MDQGTDEEIAKRVQEGEVEAFALLVNRYLEKLTRYGKKFLFYREDVKDLIQDIFLKAYMNIKGFDTKRKFSPWLYRIAHNEFINAIKKRSRLPVLRFDTDTLFPHPVTEETADGELERKELKKLLDHHLDSLKPKYREPLVLYYFEEMAYQEIAEILQIPIATVGVRLRRGKAALKVALGKANQHS
jgi:RNA polymerase sigma-70 factor (ECF subfamily)